MFGDVVAQDPTVGSQSSRSPLSDPCHPYEPSVQYYGILGRLSGQMHRRLFFPMGTLPVMAATPAMPATGGLSPTTSVPGRRHERGWCVGGLVGKWLVAQLLPFPPFPPIPYHTIPSHTNTIPYRRTIPYYIPYYTIPYIVHPYPSSPLWYTLTVLC